MDFWHLSLIRIKKGKNIDQFLLNRKPLHRYKDNENIDIPRDEYQQNFIIMNSWHLSLIRINGVKILTRKPLHPLLGYLITISALSYNCILIKHSLLQGQNHNFQLKSDRRPNTLSWPLAKQQL